MMLHEYDKIKMLLV